MVVLAGFALWENFNHIDMTPTAPVFVLGSFQACYLAIDSARMRRGPTYKPVTCSELGSLSGLFSDSKILYQGMRVIGIQGKEPEPNGRWYQVDTSDGRTLRVVEVSR
jgi:hypothetical protein